MDKENCSSLPELLLLEITNNPDMKVLILTVFLAINLIVLIINIGMIIFIKMNPQLQTPMYFFLSHLFFSDLSYSSAIGSKMLIDIFSKYKTIPLLFVPFDSFFVCIFIDVECVLPAVMAFDQYKAISHPVIYAIDMSNRVCYQFLAGVYLVGMTDALIHRTLTFCLCFCESHEINHFFCDIPPILLLSCLNTQFNELMIFTIFGFTQLSTISEVLVSYCSIILSVLKIHSAKGRFKAFSTCTLHLTAVAIFQGTLLFTYFQPSTSYSLDQDKMTSLFYTLMIPMLNPLIYSLRYKDVKETLQNLENKRWCK